MSWIQIRLHATPNEVEALENALLAVDALSVTLQDDADQPILEPELGTTPIWDQTQVIGLFDANQNSEKLLANLAECFVLEGGSALPRHKLEIVEDKDWVRAWMDDYHPMAFGERLWVCPSWREPPEANAVNLMLDPGLAFGTGTHPTTALCLRYLDKEVQGNELVVDYGCGSGILGIAALLLGSRHMIGVDIDPQALTATSNNAERNGISSDRFEIYLPDATPVVQADLTVANILAGPLMDLAPHIASLTRSGGKLALSGLLAEQAEEISACYSQWFAMNPPEQLGDWVILTGIKH